MPSANACWNPSNLAGSAEPIARPLTESSGRKFSLSCDRQMLAGQPSRQACLEREQDQKSGELLVRSVTNVASQLLYNSQESRSSPALVFTSPHGDHQRATPET